MDSRAGAGGDSEINQLLYILSSAIKGPMRYEVSELFILLDLLIWVAESISALKREKKKTFFY